MKRAYVLFGRLLLVVCMAVCFAEAAFAGSENETFKSVNHKGYNTLAPENTLPAFELSAEKGYQYVETDISFTKDGVSVLLHNPNINKMARNPDGSELAGENLEIDQITYEEALRYDFTKGMAEDNLKALHQYNHSYAEKIKAVAEGYPEDSEVRAIYEQYVQFFTEPVPGRPTEEESRLYSEEKLSNISDQLKQAAVDYYKECVRSEPQITSDLYDIAEEVGTEMFGIQNRIKSAGENKEGVCRIADKISQYMSEAELTGNPVSYEEAVRQVKDIIRYTQTGTPETLTQNYLRTKELLEEKGYELVRVRNSWETFTKKAPYRGVNTVYVSPDGIPFELQFHTAESLMTKEAEHPLYEICRDPDTSEAEREALSEERYRMYAGMTQPDRIEEIG